MYWVGTVRNSRREAEPTAPAVQIIYCSELPNKRLRHAFYLPFRRKSFDQVDNANDNQAIEDVGTPG